MTTYSFKIKDVNVTVSLEDADRVRQWTWWLGPGGYIKGHVNHRPVLLQHFILGKPQRGYVVDHINGDTADNCRENLRFATFAQNAQNVVKHSVTSSRFKGVQKVSNGWKVNIAGKYIATLPRETDAARAYNFHALQMYGVDAALNDVAMSPDYKFEYKKRRSPASISRRYNRPSTFGVRFKHVGKVKVKWFKTEQEATDFHLSLQAEEPEVNVSPLRNEEGIAIIVLNTGKEVLVDDDQWHMLTKHTWHEYNGYAFNGHCQSMHRLLSCAPQGTLVDHINGNRLDNRLHNLRIASFSDNSQNKRKKEGCSSQFIGVYRTEGKWRAYIKYQYKTYSLGCYTDEVAAARAYNQKAKELYDNPRLNNV